MKDEIHYPHFDIHGIENTQTCFDFEPKKISISNIRGHSIKLFNNSSQSKKQEDRLIIGSDITLKPSESIQMMYDNHQSGWILMKEF